MKTNPFKTNFLDTQLEDGSPEKMVPQGQCVCQFFAVRNWRRRVLTTSGAAPVGGVGLIFQYFFQVAEATGRRLGPFVDAHDASFTQDSSGKMGGPS